MTNPFAPYPMPKLTCELVPSTSWGENLRSLLSAGQWKDLRTACYVRAHHKCEICGGVGRKHPVEAHEIWHYDDTQRRQTLMGLIALCPACHKCKHMGFALSTGKLESSLKHMSEVNEWPLNLTYDYVERQFHIHHLRSQLQWTVDTSWLTDADSYIKSAAKDSKAALSESVLELLKSKRNTDALS
ncbi:HNH endonuclease [Pseudomonas phage hairong]|nr:HNH endonuclease [Pseudomonas phage hairong]